MCGKNKATSFQDFNLVTIILKVNDYFVPMVSYLPNLIIGNLYVINHGNEIEVNEALTAVRIRNDLKFVSNKLVVFLIDKSIISVLRLFCQ